MSARCCSVSAYTAMARRPAAVARPAGASPGLIGRPRCPQQMLGRKHASVPAFKKMLSERHGAGEGLYNHSSQATMREEPVRSRSALRCCSAPLLLPWPRVVPHVPPKDPSSGPLARNLLLATTYSPCGSHFDHLFLLAWAARGGDPGCSCFALCCWWALAERTKQHPRRVKAPQQREAALQALPPARPPALCPPLLTGLPVPLMPPMLPVS